MGLKNEEYITYNRSSLIFCSIKLKMETKTFDTYNKELRHRETTSNLDLSILQSIISFVKRTIDL